jgi:hypothetical protein
MSNLRHKIQYKLAVQSVNNFFSKTGLANIVGYFNQEDFPEIQEKLKGFIKIGAEPQDSLSISSSTSECKNWFMRILNKVSSDAIFLTIDVFNEDACVWCKVNNFNGINGLFKIWEATGFKSMSIYDKNSDFYIVIFKDESYEAYWSNIS